MYWHDFLTLLGFMCETGLSLRKILNLRVWNTAAHKQSLVWMCHSGSACNESWANERENTFQVVHRSSGMSTWMVSSHLKWLWALLGDTVRQKGAMRSFVTLWLRTCGLDGDRRLRGVQHGDGNWGTTQPCPPKPQVEWVREVTAVRQSRGLLWAHRWHLLCLTFLHLLRPLTNILYSSLTSNLLTLLPPSLLLTLLLLLIFLC